MKNIILIGMPGCGKSTLGRRLAGALHRSFVDADTYLEEKEGKSIPELFAVSEDCFRDAEERTIEALAKRESLVIATGGGVVKRAVNIERLKKTGTIYFIDRHAVPRSAERHTTVMRSRCASSANPRHSTLSPTARRNAHARRDDDEGLGVSPIK